MPALVVLNKSIAPTITMLELLGSTAMVKSYQACPLEKSVEGINGESLLMLCDPQTNGGLMIAVSESHLKDFKILLSQNNLTDFIEPVGKFMPAKEKNIYINY